MYIGTSIETMKNNAVVRIQLISTTSLKVCSVVVVVVVLVVLMRPTVRSMKDH